MDAGDAGGWCCCCHCDGRRDVCERSWDNICNMKMNILIIPAHLFFTPSTSPAAQSPSKAVGKVGLGGSHVLSPAATVPCEGVRWETFLCEKWQISIISFTFFTVPVAFPVGLNPSRAVGEVGLSGGGAWLAAAAVPGASAVRYECFRSKNGRSSPIVLTFSPFYPISCGFWPIVRGGGGWIWLSCCLADSSSDAISGTRRFDREMLR